MNTKMIGQYIQLLRKQKGLSQKELAERLCVSFQAVSKWETGENLPDASLLLDLADILDTTTDKILSGGSIVLRRNKKVNVCELKEGLDCLRKLRRLFGDKSSFYVGAMEGINAKLNVDVEGYLEDENGGEMLLAEAVIQCLINGYRIEGEDIEAHFQSESLKRKIRKYCFDCGLFSDKAAAYSSYRPSYPREVIDLIFSLVKAPVVADIGSGTGKLAELCLEGARTVFSVEPNKQMRQAAEEILGHHHNYVSIPASAEHTTLADNAVDIITVAEAFHWFDNEATYAEFSRILKPGGYVFLLWNSFGGDEYDEEMAQISNRYRLNFKRSGYSYEDRAVHLFGEGGYQKAEFDNSIFQTREEFCGGWASASYIPARGTAEYDEFWALATALFEKYAKDGVLKSTITTVCFYGTLNS